MSTALATTGSSCIMRGPRSPHIQLMPADTEMMSCIVCSGTPARSATCIASAAAAMCTPHSSWLIIFAVEPMPASLADMEDALATASNTGRARSNDLVRPGAHDRQRCRRVRADDAAGHRRVEHRQPVFGEPLVEPACLRRRLRARRDDDARRPAARRRRPPRRTARPRPDRRSPPSAAARRRPARRRLPTLRRRRRPRPAPRARGGAHVEAAHRVPGAQQVAPPSARPSRRDR